MAERNSRVLGVRLPVEEYERLRARAAAERKTVGGLALELVRAALRPSQRRGSGQPGDPGA